jgi:NAD-dependent SIR2 family protein deacetylase
MSDRIPKCPSCDKVVKPDIVFFGEVGEATGWETGWEV